MVAKDFDLLLAKVLGEIAGGVLVGEFENAQIAAEADDLEGKVFTIDLNQPLGVLKSQHDTDAFGAAFDQEGMEIGESSGLPEFVDEEPGLRWDWLQASFRLSQENLTDAVD